MDLNQEKLWSSLPVPCVQELAKEVKTAIPPRYIQVYQDPPNISDAGPENEVPVVDMQLLLSEDSMEAELAKINFACTKWGFFQLINHGVDTFLVDKVKMGIHDFFNLPMEEKKKYWQGAEIEGFGQAFVVSEEQKLDWSDLFFMITRPVHLRKPHLFPKIPQPFRDSLEAYSLELKNLAKTVLAQMAKALKMNEEEMKELFDEGMQSMRMNYYPPCPKPDKVVGLTPHSDSVGLTILLQVNEVEGLQIWKDGKWVTIKPLPNAFIVNIGDILEIITNGVYRSIKHRAVINSDKERISIATFCSPRLDGEMGPASSLISDHSPPLFRRISVQEYFQGLFTRELRGKSYLDAMRITQGETIGS